MDDVEPSVALPDFFPQVAGFVPGLIMVIVCVALAAIIARVEGQKEGFVTCEARGHVRFVCIDGKMHQSAFFVLEQGRFGSGHAVFFILVDSVLGALTREGVFEFDCGNGQAVERQEHVDDAVAVQVVTHLPHHSEAVLIVAAFCVGIQTGRRAKIGQAEMLPPVAHPIANHVEQTAGIAFGGDAFDHRIFNRAAISHFEGVQCVGLRGFEKGERGVLVQAQCRIELPAVSLDVPGSLDQPRLNRGLKISFQCGFGGHCSISFCPNNNQSDIRAK